MVERWLTPWLFEGTDAVDHYTLMQAPDGPARLARHIAEYITEADFVWLRDHHIEVVRIPVGYWIFDGDDPYQPCIEALDWAVEMGHKYGIKVLICLHGAPGSQNGRDHSGRIGPAQWYRRRDYHQQTIAVLERLAARYADRPSAWGLELLNEPRAGFWQFKLKRFSRQAYQRVSRVARPDMLVVFHDAFTPRLMSNLLWPHRHNPVAIDVHWYHFCWPLFRVVLIAWYERIAMPMHHRLHRWLSRAQPVIVGEWSGMLSEYQLRKFAEAEHAALVDRHIALQLAAYDNTLAWFYWNYRAAAPGVWDFRSMVDAGRIML